MADGADDEFLGMSQGTMASTAMGAGTGALQGGMIGAGIGSLFPGAGTAIGAGIGAVAGGLLGGTAGYMQGMSTQEAQEAAQKAASIQASGLRESQAITQPWTEAGQAALQSQQALAGLLGPEAQAAAIGQLEASPQFQSMLAQGERAILQNAAATGGLRGGNVQAMLAQYRPQLLSSVIEQQYARLGGLAGGGLTAGMGQAGIGADIAAAQAGGAKTAAELEYALKQQQAGMLMAPLQAGAQMLPLLANFPGLGGEPTPTTTPTTTAGGMQGPGSSSTVYLPSSGQGTIDGVTYQYTPAGG